MTKSKVLLVIAAFLAAILPGQAQVFKLTPEQMKAYTAGSTFERFEDGRPKVPDSILERVKDMSMEEVMADLEASLTATAAAPETSVDDLAAVVGLPAGPARAGAAPAVASRPKARKPSRGPRMVPIVVGGVLGVLAFVLVVEHFQSKKPAEVAKSAVLPAAKNSSPAEPSRKSRPGPAQPPAASQDTPAEAMPEPPAGHDEAAKKLTGPRPKKPADSKPRPSPKLKPAAKPGSSPLPVPDEAARERASKTVRDMFQAEIEKAGSDGEKSALAKRILRQAKDLNDDPAGRYAMLETCCALSKDAVDAATAMEAMDVTSRYYAVDEWSAKANMLTEFAKGAKQWLHHWALAQQAAALAQKAVEAGQVDIADQLSELAVAEAGKTSDPRTNTRIRATIKEVEKAVALRREYEVAKTKLQENSRNPEANLSAGRYECLVAGNWNEGLRKLAAGSDGTLRALAAKDLADPKGPEQQAGVGDGWWDLAEVESGTARDHCYRRAARWYKKASGRATGTLKAKLEKRLDTIKAIEPAGDL